MANKPGFDGDFTITAVENLFNEWDNIPFPNTKAIAFNGVDNESQVAVGDDDSLSYGADGTIGNEPHFSLSAWIKPNGTLTHNFTIVTKSDSGAPGEYIWYTQTTPRMYFLLRDGTGGKQIYAYETATNITLGQWNHVCVTYNGNATPAGMTLYVNGSPVGNTTGTTGVYVAMENTTANFSIGRLYSSLTTNVTEGLIDEVAAFKKELSAIEVAEIYNSGFVFNLHTFSGVADLVSWWRMGDKATGVSPNFTIPDQIGPNDAAMSAFLGDSTSGLAPGAPEQPPIAGAIPISLAAKGILFRNRSKPYVVSNGGTPDDIII